MVNLSYRFIMLQTLNKRNGQDILEPVSQYSSYHHHRSFCDGMLEAAVTNFLQASLSNMSCWTLFGSRSRSRKAMGDIGSVQQTGAVVSLYEEKNLIKQIVSVSKLTDCAPYCKKLAMTLSISLSGWSKDELSQWTNNTSYKCTYMPSRAGIDYYFYCRQSTKFNSRLSTVVDKVLHQIY